VDHFLGKRYLETRVPPGWFTLPIQRHLIDSTNRDIHSLPCT